MAKMYPTVLDPETQSSAERRPTCFRSPLASIDFSDCGVGRAAPRGDSGLCQISQ